MPKPSEKVLIRGLVVPSEWKQDGQVVKVTIKTFDEEEYVVSGTKAFKELLIFLRKEVAVKGIVKLNKGKKLLSMCKIIK